MAARLSFTCLAFLLVPSFYPAGEAPKAVGFRDDFATDTRKDYEVTGDVAWRKGLLTLAEGARLRRPLELGETLDVTASLRLPPGKGDARLGLTLAVSPRPARLDVARAAGRWRLRQQVAGTDLVAVLPAGVERAAEPAEPQLLPVQPLQHIVARRPLGHEDALAGIDRRRERAVVLRPHELTGVAQPRQVSGVLEERVVLARQVRKHRPGDGLAGVGLRHLAAHQHPPRQLHLDLVLRLPLGPVEPREARQVRRAVGRVEFDQRDRARRAVDAEVALLVGPNLEQLAPLGPPFPVGEEVQQHLLADGLAGVFADDLALQPARRLQGAL